MSTTPKRIALVCMTPDIDANEHENTYLPSYGIRRILASVADDPELAGSSVTLIDFEAPDVAAYVQAIVDFQPDIVGFSIYVWSAPIMIEVARHIKRINPSCMIVFGGPSARVPFFDLPPHRPANDYLDAVVSSEGEVTFNEIAKLPRVSRESLATIGGLHIPDTSGWKHTGPRTPITTLDQIASPFQLGLMQQHCVAYLETYRGCPLSCRFCEWGATESPRLVFSKDYLARELQAFADHGCPSVFLLDAGLNLNARAFRNLCAAEADVGFLKHTDLWAEIYPSHIRDEHLEFLELIGTGYLGIGLQSLDEDVLRQLDRPFDRRQFELAVRDLARVAHGELQIIMGLPTDSPAEFRRTLDFARSLPVAVRAYHCLVLPDALLTRSKPEWEVKFDPVTLEMVQCSGWSCEALTDMREYLSREAVQAGGKAGNYWWYFPGPSSIRSVA